MANPTGGDCGWYRPPPRSDEYWYVLNEFSNQLDILKIVEYGKDLTKVNCYYVDYYVYSDRLMKKWEPNWFWRLLGFK
jgi:hypothetical protein